MTPVTATAAAPAGKKGGGKGKGVKAKFVDAKKSTLTVHRQLRKDGVCVVKAIHVVVGQKPKTGMVFVLKNEAEGTKKFDEIVAMAEKAKWVRQISGGKSKATKNEFDTIPAPAV